MGIQVGTTITVVFDAEQIAKLDSLLQAYEMFTYDPVTDPQRYQKAQEDVAKIYRALHKAGYR
jgi:hypothetical protein